MQETEIPLSQHHIPHSYTSPTQPNMKTLFMHTPMVPKLNSNINTIQHNSAQHNTTQHLPEHKDSKELISSCYLPSLLLLLLLLTQLATIAKIERKRERL